MELIRQRIKESIAVKEKIFKDDEILKIISDISKLIIEAFRNDKKVLLCGNGGSAADAQHIAAELSGRFYLDREALFAEALHVNTSYLTAVANDYSYDEVFSRLVKAKGSKMYRIGQRERYCALRDVLTNVIYAPLRRLRAASVRASSKASIPLPLALCRLYLGLKGRFL